MIIEGIYALSERLRPLLDLRVSVTGGVHFDLVKRVLRDINRSGQAPEDIIHQISETVRFCPSRVGIDLTPLNASRILLEAMISAYIGFSMFFMLMLKL